MTRILSLIVGLMWVGSVVTFFSAVAAQTPTVMQQIAEILEAGFSAVVFAICTVAILALAAIAKAAR